VLIDHKKYIQIRWVVVIAVIAMVLPGCTEFDSEKPPIYCLDSIDDAKSAESITEQIIYSIYFEVRDLSNGTHVDKVVSGARGSMTINGYICIFCYPTVIDVSVNMESYSRLPQIRNDMNGVVNYVDDDGILEIADSGSPVAITIDDPYIYPSEGFHDCPLSFEDISDTIISLSASATSENLWYLCPGDYCSREVQPYGYIITENGQFNF
jgi:hypothetical protein